MGASLSSPIRTNIDGLEWRPNQVRVDHRGRVHVDLNESCGVTEFLHNTNIMDNPEWLSVHLGQNDLLTYFGDPSERLKGLFIDCRRHSRTLHARVELEFSPDYRKHLFIERGIAHTIYSKKCITVRVESQLFTALNNPNFEMQNDSINFPANGPFPSFMVNDIPLPAEVAKYMLGTQQRALMEH